MNLFYYIHLYTQNQQLMATSEPQGPPELRPPLLPPSICAVKGGPNECAWAAGFGGWAGEYVYWVPGYNDFIWDAGHFTQVRLQHSGNGRQSRAVLFVACGVPGVWRRHRCILCRALCIWFGGCTAAHAIPARAGLVARPGFKASRRVPSKPCLLPSNHHSDPDPPCCLAPP